MAQLSSSYYGTDETKLKSSLAKPGRLVFGQMFPQFLCVDVLFLTLRVFQTPAESCVLAFLPAYLTAGTNSCRPSVVLYHGNSFHFGFSSFPHHMWTHAPSTQQQNKSSLYLSSKEQQRKKTSRKAEGHTVRIEVKVLIRDWDTGSGCSCRKENDEIGEIANVWETKIGIKGFQRGVWMLISRCCWTSCSTPSFPGCL